MSLTVNPDHVGVVAGQNPPPSPRWRFILYSVFVFDILNCVTLISIMEDNKT